ncbi:hypothetical protein FA10DRAFT_264068 [Acaromyces ingoldii]|uniref:Required for respiratory growth protein 9, mitochondrial n=1 Tax=Acaromyces ingoldii TaxID=215250 RepID=A0A316YXQ7_9BASI|nr:hypothetical protein FA10DRAFT_264068 [Acaromyces ingoldii]PWN93418.1 hypothetical protein FA10DRAFT_264068 [Acaromyces ingoldii]
MAARQRTLQLVRGTSRSPLSASRGLATSRLVSFPRQIRPRFNTDEAPAATTPTTPLTTPSAGSSSSSSSAKPTLPWFLQDQAEEVVAAPVETASAALIEKTLPLSTAGSALPDALIELDELLTTGPSSPLLRRRRSDQDDEEETAEFEREPKRPPIVYIDAKARDADAWADWIVVVEVQARSGITRVAKDVGNYLKRAPRPASLGSIPSSLQEGDTVGPPERLRGSSASTEGSASLDKQPWRPRKILSREAQEGLRLLHAHDPETYSRQALAAQFKISVEAVRRILKSKFRPDGAVVSRQNRRAKEREDEWKRGMLEGPGWKLDEARELEKIKQSISSASSGREESVEEEEEEEEAEDQDEVAWALEGEEGAPRGKNRVRYEGLDDAQSSSRARRGGGDWCLVDAEWCVVHVMTPEARSTYDVEGIWERAPPSPVDEAESESSGTMKTTRILAVLVYKL